MPAGIGAIFTGILGTAGVGAATADVIGSVLGDAAFGSVLGGTVSSIEGKGFGAGALTGALTGGALGGAGELASGLGLSSTATDILDVGAGAGAGALGAKLTGLPVGQGALFGGIAGGFDAALSGGPSGGVTSPSGAPGAAGGAGGVGSAGTTAGALGTGDLTAATNVLSPEGYSLGAGPAATGSLSAGPGAVGGDVLTPEGFSLGPSAGSVGAPSSGDFLTGGAGLTPTSTSGALSAGPVSTPVSGSDITPNNLGVPNLPTSGGGTGTGALAAGKGSGGFLSQLTKPSSLLAAGGLAYEALSAPKLPNESAITNQLNATASGLQTQANTLESYLQNGTLPPGAQEAINTATSSAKAAIRSQYASMGLTGSTAEVSALSQVDQQAAGQVFSIANNLLQTGIKETGLSSEIYGQILGEVNQQNQIMATAIANFAGAVAGSSKGITLNVAGAQPTKQAA